MLISKRQRWIYSHMDILTKYSMVNIIEAQVVDNTFKFVPEFRNALLSRGIHHKVF